jgi:hypothetical protein
VVLFDPVVDVCGQVLESYLSGVVLGSVVVGGVGVGVGVGDVVFFGSLVVGVVGSAGLVDDFLVFGFPVGL